MNVEIFHLEYVVCRPRNEFLFRHSILFRFFHFTSGETKSRKKERAYQWHTLCLKEIEMKDRKKYMKEKTNWKEKQRERERGWCIATGRNGPKDEKSAKEKEHFPSCDSQRHSARWDALEVERLEPREKEKRVFAWQTDLEVANIDLPPIFLFSSVVTSSSYSYSSFTVFTGARYRP